MEIQYYGKYNANGEYIAFYATDIWDISEIPVDECILLDYNKWQEALSQRCKVIDGVHTIVIDTAEEIEAAAFIELRYTRDKLLNDSDWTQMPDSPLTDVKKQEWMNYRQQLRDLPNTVDINNISYPEKPQ